jgi:DNA repair exonuclease SbcCD ATPase subunit
MRRSVSVIAVLFLLFPLAILAQHGGRHGGSTGTSGGTNAPAQDPDMATFKHAMAVQASQQQIAQFALMIKSTEAARQQAHDLQHLGSDASDSHGLIGKATGLQNSVEAAQNENRAFRRSLSDSQEAGLKTLTKKLTKSDSAVSKGAKAISRQLEQGMLDWERLASAAANLEKALAALQSDQLNLGKEMGIQSH